MKYTSLYNRRPRLLIVDDEAYNVQLLERIFHRDCDVDTAFNGKEALDLIDLHNYDVILLDIMMPVVNGLDVLKIVRSTRDISELPVVLISAINDEPEVARGIRLGANDYIAKPIDIDVVVARVNTQITLHYLIEERQQMIQQLQEANSLKVSMMQIASHDIKNPLSNLQLLTSMMKRHIAGEERMERLLKMQDDSINTMLDVVQDFLDSSLVASNDVKMALVATSTMDIINKVVNQYTIMAQNKNIRIEADSLSGTVMADPNRLVQVIGNLVSNALKYSPQGSVVRIETLKNEQFWRLNVIDQGPGVPVEEREHLFQAFSRDKISTRPTGGERSTGLGLWIVAEMIRLQGGLVGVDFPESGGSIFWVEMELAQAGGKQP